MVWLAISEEGISEPSFCPCKVSVSGDIHHKHCIRDRLLPFLDKFHTDGKYFFWPDLATSHYAKKTVELLEVSIADYIPKSANPPNYPNYPHLRPIEDFWGSRKASVYSGE